MNRFFCVMFLILPVLGLAQSQILLRKGDGGLFYIPCKVNKKSIEFIFDTGASSITLSSSEANSLLASGHLLKTDVMGKMNMQIADGQIVEGVIVNLREIVVGDLKLKNVEAVVVGSQKAPLLFGQSAIKGFGEFSFDYSTGILKILKKSLPSKSFQLRDEHKKGLTHEQLASYEVFYKNKATILENLDLDLVKYSTNSNNGDTQYMFDFDITNNSEFDFSHTKQLMALPLKVGRIQVTLYTEEGKTYTGVAHIADILAGNTSTNNYVTVNIRGNTLKGIKYKIIDSDF